MLEQSISRIPTTHKTYKNKIKDNNNNNNKADLWKKINESFDIEIDKRDTIDNIINMIVTQETFTNKKKSNRNSLDEILNLITQDNNTEGVLLYNVPIRKPFRIGVVLSDKVIEVYTNGLLSRTKSLSSPAKPVQGKFWPSPTTGIQLRNLHIWPTTIMPVEMRTALPALSSSTFEVTSLQDTASCAIIENTARTLRSAIE